MGIVNYVFTSELAIRKAKQGSVESSTKAKATGLLRGEKQLCHSTIMRFDQQTINLRTFMSKIKIYIYFFFSQTPRQLIILKHV